MRLSRLGIAINVALQVLLCIGLCVGINLLSYRYYARHDLSVSSVYSLSSSSTAFLDKTTKPMEAFVVFARGSPMLEESIYPLMEAYRRQSNGRLAVHYLDPTRDRERAEQLKVENSLRLEQYGILLKVGSSSRFVSQAEMLIQSPGTDSDKPVIDFRGEDAITSALSRLHEGGKRKFYLIGGKGSRPEASSEELLAALQSLGLQQDFEVGAFTFGEAATIPADANGLFLIGPRYDLTQSELAQLSLYWQGRRAALCILLDPSAETPLLQRFLQANGVTPRNDRVLFAESTSAGPRKELSVEATFNRELSITRAVADAVTRFSGQTQSLALAKDDPVLREQGLIVLPLATAATRYWGESAYLDPLPTAGGPGDIAPPVAIAAMVERGAVQDASLRVDSARLFVAGCPSLLDKDTRLAVNQDLMAGVANWMLDREDRIGITPKRKHQYRIQLSDRQRELLFLITAVCGPAVVLAWGFSVWARRRAL